VKPVIEKRCEFVQIAAAMREMGEGHARGKTVVTLGAAR
jgi:D-arabinose 1-dehydrogenase-like Zn-dependent alcohol dehydrogenase